MLNNVALATDFSPLSNILFHSQHISPISKWFVSLQWTQGSADTMVLATLLFIHHKTPPSWNDTIFYLSLCPLSFLWKVCLKHEHLWAKNQTISHHILSISNDLKSVVSTRSICEVLVVIRCCINKIEFNVTDGKTKQICSINNKIKFSLIDKHWGQLRAEAQPTVTN